MEWRPFDSDDPAPKDGRRFLACWINRGEGTFEYGVIWWKDGDWHEYDPDIDVNPPTYWCHIQPPSR